ncbi:hypothetical protein [Agriterribacter humi]|uniref:hypothetical protein n=1 Tax=Agriterribacter humi TaxID=1104781 RepID=UPI001264FFED|nr:hypothetical protein [Agriterribacter humi]
MKQLLIVLLLGVYSLTISAQTDTIRNQKPQWVWVYTTGGKMQKGILAGRTDSALLLYQGSKKAYKKQEAPPLAGIHYKNITIIKTRSKLGFLKGMGIGAGIGIAPVLFGEGGAYVAVVSFPTGLIAGSSIGFNAKKKNKINGDFAAFRGFADKFIK